MSAILLTPFVAPAKCADDVNSDGVVNVIDLLAVINAWGSCGSPEDAPQNVDQALCSTGVLPPEDCPE